MPGGRHLASGLRHQSTVDKLFAVHLAKSETHLKIGTSFRGIQLIGNEYGFVSGQAHGLSSSGRNS